MSTIPETADAQTPTADPFDPSYAFTIDSDHAAEWLLRKLASIEAERSRVTAQAETILRQLECDAASLQHLYGPALEAYCRSKLHASGNRRRSVAFLQGTCAFRSVPAGLKIADPASALQFAQTQLPDAVKTVQTLDITLYRAEADRHLQQFGSLLPGVETTPARESFSVRFGNKPE